MTSAPQGDEAAGDGVHRTVLECLAHADAPLCALEVAQRTHLSTLVVVPVLTQLLDDLLVERARQGRPGARSATWGYTLTGRGSRLAARGAARLPRAGEAGSPMRR